MSIDTTIKALHGRQVFDSRGRPTVEAEVTLRDGTHGVASVPSGASTGRHEAHELRDGDPSAYAGRGVLGAVENINGEIARALVGRDAVEQAALDALMYQLDGTANLARLGANAVLAVSLAVCRAAAGAHGMPLYRRIGQLAGVTEPTLPMPMVNILSGGAHAARGMDLQDFLVMPVGAATFEEAMRTVMKVRDAADDVMRRRGLPTLLADEGGLSPGCRHATEALDLMLESIHAAGLEPGRDAAIALDIAASELFSDGRYQLRNVSLGLTGDDMISMVHDWLRAYPIISIEDPLHQDDWEHWTRLTASTAGVQIVGDDLFATQVARIERGIASQAANAVLIKPNQNGTLSGTLAALAQGRRAGWATIVSARSGETEDAFIADLAVGAGAGQIKIGSVRNAERMAKYNRLIGIDEASGRGRTRYEGGKPGVMAPNRRQLGES